MRDSFSFRPVVLFLVGIAGVLSFVSSTIFVPAPVLADGAVRSKLISEELARSVGLTRPWFNQVTMDIQHHRITHVTLQDDTLFITTDVGQLHAIDGKTGETLWSRRIGNENFYTHAPAANSEVVAVVHGASIFVFDRFTGKRLLVIPTYAAVGSGPQVSERYIYVPLLTGKIFAYPLKKIPMEDPNLALSLEQVKAIREKSSLSHDMEKKLDRLIKDTRVEMVKFAPVDDSDIQSCPALGHPLVQPFLCSEDHIRDNFGWVTDNGWMMIAELRYDKLNNALKLLYRVSLTPEDMYFGRSHLRKAVVEYNNDINYRPTFIQKDITQANLQKGESAKGGLVFLGAGSGFVFAINDVTGDVQWKFSAGVAVADPIGVSNGYCYIPTFNGTFICVEIKTGHEVWRISGVKQFIAGTKGRLYVLDFYGRIASLDPTDGHILNTLPLDIGTRAVFNIESDRIYIVAPDGLVQSLHEPQLEEPLHYRKTTMEIAEEIRKYVEEVRNVPVKNDKKAASPAAAPAPAANPNPAPAAAPASNDEENPFAEPAVKDEKPASEAQENPFADTPAAAEEKKDEPKNDSADKPSENAEKDGEKPADDSSAKNPATPAAENPFE